MATNVQRFEISGEALFGVLSDPDTYPHWLVGAKRIRSVEPGWPNPGSSFRHTVGFGPIEIADRTSVRELDPPHMLELQVRARPAVQAVVRFEIETGSECPVGECVLRMTETPAGFYKLASLVAQPLILARNARSMQRLLDFVSAGVTPTLISSQPGDP